jgi:hypothetical protein
MKPTMGRPLQLLRRLSTVSQLESSARLSYLPSEAKKWDERIYVLWQGKGRFSALSVEAAIG